MDFALFALGLTLIGAAIKGVMYPASRGGHHFRRPIYLRSTPARAGSFIVGFALLIWLAFRLVKVI
jgi:hypothetical protein